MSSKQSMCVDIIIVKCMYGTCIAYIRKKKMKRKKGVHDAHWRLSALFCWMCAARAPLTMAWWLVEDWPPWFVGCRQSTQIRIITLAKTIWRSNMCKYTYTLWVVCLRTRSDPNTKIKVAQVRVRVLNFAHREGKWREGEGPAYLMCCVLVAGATKTCAAGRRAGGCRRS